MKRRGFLKAIGLLPALPLVPWTPASEKIAPPPPPPAPVEPRKLSLDEALRLVDWEALDLPPAPETAINRAVSYSATGMSGFYFGDAKWDDGPDWEA